MIFRNSIKVALGKRTGNDRPITTTPNHQITKCIPRDTTYKDKDKHKEKKDKDRYRYYNTNTNNATATSHHITKCILCDIDLLLPFFDADDDNK